jgi:predicted RNA binding protein YcfA (HicA-like mRNA interferase family)
VKLPRDLSGADLVKALRHFGYAPTRQSGSHIRLTTSEGGDYHVTVPSHSPLRVGTLAAILDLVAAHAKLTRESVVEKIFR